MTMKKIPLYAVSAVAFTIGATASAFAGSADAEQSWTGPFIGLNVGYGFDGDTDITRGSGPPGPPGIDTTNSIDGVIGGAQLGYNFAFSGMPLVVGIVGDFTLVDFDATNADGGGGPPSVWETNYDWIATVRARAGMLVDPSALVYLHGGVAFAEIETQEVGGAGPWAGLSSNHTETGFVVGAGAEMQISDGISAFAEYSYLSFGDSKVTPSGPPGSLTFDNSDMHILKVGINVSLDSLFGGM